MSSSCSGGKTLQGVRQRQSGRWSAEIQVSKKRRWLGSFDTAEEAAIAYNKAALELHRPDAIINSLSEQSALDSLSGLREGERMTFQGLQKGGQKKFFGVRQKLGKWVAEIQEPNRGPRRWLGTYGTAKEAALAYDKAAKEMYRLNAVTNFCFEGSPDELNFQSSESDLIANLAKEFSLGFSYNIIKDEFADVEEVLESFQ